MTDERPVRESVLTLPFAVPHPAFAVLHATLDEVLSIFVLAALWEADTDGERVTTYLCTLADVDAQIERIPGEQVFFTVEAADAFLERRRARRTDRGPHA